MSGVFTGSELSPSTPSLREIRRAQSLRADSSIAHFDLPPYPTNPSHLSRLTLETCHLGVYLVGSFLPNFSQNK